MGSEENRNRVNWQKCGLKNAKEAEDRLMSCFEKHFEGTTYSIESQPKEFKNSYLNVVLDEEELEAIYTPEEEIKKHGFAPDFAIRNSSTKKTLYIEMKRQDGWVEGGKRQDGRGNAHERSCKFFTPGLKEILHQHGNIDRSQIPFWVILNGDITRDPCRVREIRSWYKGIENHVFFWRPPNENNALTKHFEDNLKYLLD